MTGESDSIKTTIENEVNAEIDRAFMLHTSAHTRAVLRNGRREPQNTKRIKLREDAQSTVYQQVLCVCYSLSSIKNRPHLLFRTEKEVKLSLSTS